MLIFADNNNDIFELHQGENLLEILERRGYPVAYQCRNGYCGACRIKKTAGEVVYDKPPLAYVNHDEILPCCCTVTTPLTLEIDKNAL